MMRVIVAVLWRGLMPRPSGELTFYPPGIVCESRGYAWFPTPSPSRSPRIWVRRRAMAKARRITLQPRRFRRSQRRMLAAERSLVLHSIRPIEDSPGRST